MADGDHPVERGGYRAAVGLLRAGARERPARRGSPTRLGQRLRRSPAPAALVRMLAPSTSRSERILLFALTTLFLYWIKVLHDPVGLWIPDEFYHLANAQRLAETGRLYGKNNLLPVSPDYPGLTVITVALSKLSGIGLFPCALVLIGVVKVGLAVVLFLLFERLSGSARIGGVAALFYCAGSSDLYFTSQFSYESLSVPLLAGVLLCLVARTGSSARSAPRRLRWVACSPAPSSSPTT